MNLTEVIPAFKRYALFEKGMQPRTVKEIISLVSALSESSHVSGLNSIRTSQVRNFLYERKQQRLWGNKTFRNARQYLKCFFDFCIRADLINTNPVEKIEKPRISKRLPRSLSRAQVQQLLLQLDCYSWYSDLERKRNQAIVRMFLMSGVRLSELLRLKSSAVNLGEGAITVYQGKGRKDRIVPIFPKLLPYLKVYSESKKGISEYFFTSLRSNKPLTEKNLYAIFKKLRKPCEFHCTPHMLRHTFGKMSIEANLNPFILRDIMGHSDIGTTQIYVSASSDSIKRSFQKIDLV